MNGFIRDYSGGNRLCVVVRSPEFLDDLNARKVDAMYITGENVSFTPTGTCSIPSSSVVNINEFYEGDIVEISSEGVVYKAYSSVDTDPVLFMGGGCNSNCVMCPASDTERRKAYAPDEATLMKYIEYLPEDVGYLVITGGEPTMRPFVFLEALEKVRLKFRNTQVLLLTNGRSFADPFFFDETYKRLPDRFRVAIPLHGHNPEIHDRITRASGSFRQTMSGISRFNHAHVTVEIRIVVTQYNVEYLKQIASMISSSFPDVYCVNFVGLEPRGNCALNRDTVYIDYEDAFRAAEPAIQYLLSHGINVGLYNFPLCKINPAYWSMAYRSISSYKNVYMDGCDPCQMKEKCCGFFTAAKNFIHPSVQPIMKGGQLNA